MEIALATPTQLSLHQKWKEAQTRLGTIKAFVEETPRLVALRHEYQIELSRLLAEIAGLRELKVERDKLRGELFAEFGPVDTIIETVASAYGITATALISHKREHRYTRPRQIAFYIIKKKTGDSLVKIARRMHRDHTTILYAVRKIENLRAVDAALDGQIIKLLEVLSHE